MGCRPEPTFFRPERSEGSPPWDPVPNEVRDASLSLGRTKKDARRDKVGGTFFEQPQPHN